MKQVVVVVIGLLLSLTIFAGIVPWTLGDNRVVAEAAQDGKLPKVLGKMTKSMAPSGAAIISGLISTAVIFIYGFIARNAAELFWHTISFSTVVNLFSYLMLFPAFIILRIKDKDIDRPYRVPGPEWLAVSVAVIAETFVLLTISVLIFQPGHDFIRTALPVISGILITIFIGEIFIKHSTSNSS
jgi:amino acid transporter